MPITARPVHALRRCAPAIRSAVRLAAIVLVALSGCAVPADPSVDALTAEAPVKPPPAVALSIVPSALASNLTDLPGAYEYVGTLPDCPGAWDPACHRAVVCPEPSDPIPTGSRAVTPGSLPAAGFCPTGTTAGGVTTTCSTPVTGYTRASSPLVWLDACAVAGHGTYLPNVDDGTDTAALPFAFSFYGTAYTSVGLSSNGMLAFGPASAVWTNAPLPSASAPNAVFPAWDDLVLRAGGVCTATFGTAPARVFVAEWSDAYLYSDSTAHMTFEVALSEGSNTVDVLYHQMDTGARPTGGHATVGIQNGASGPADQAAYNAAGAAAAGVSYRWTPSSVACASGVYTRVIAGTCAGLDPTDLPFWGQIQYTSNVPPGTRVRFAVATASTAGGLASATPVALPDAPPGAPAAPTFLDLGAILRAASPNTERLPYLQLTAYLDPAASGTVAPTLGSVEVRYDCNPNEYLYTCAPGSACNPGTPCRLGAIACPIPQRGVCTDAGPAPMGSSCGAGMVCSATGACVACTEGASCTVPGGCATGRTSCATGSPVCMAVSNLPAGTVCGSTAAGYTRAGSPQPWLDACNAVGHGTYLSGVDDGVTVVSLPFSHRFYGTAYTQVGLSSNGVLGFPTVTNAWLNASLPAAGMPDAVFPFWDDLVVGTAAGTGVCTATFGTAPTRQFVAEWSHVQFSGGVGAPDDMSFETVLTESTGTVDVLYGAMTSANDRATGSHATVGIQQGAGPGYDMVAYNTPNAVAPNTGYRWIPSAGSQCDGLGTCRACSPEVCDGIDNNCNGIVDEGCAGTVTCPTAVTTQAGTAVALAATVTGTVNHLVWSITTGPTGGAAVATWSPSTPTGPSVTFTPTLVGNYTVTATGTDGSGNPVSCSVPVAAVTHGLRVELTWDGPGDLDIHLHNDTSTPWYSSNDCFYANRSATSGAVLDYDNTVANGPENIRMDIPTVGVPYTIAMHNYARGAGRIATVKVYCGTTAGTVPTAVFTSRPLAGDSSGNCTANDFWRIGRIVFTSGSTCAITPIDTYAPSTTACAGL